MGKGGQKNYSQKQKLYCYVDESGQDTKGKLFVVSVVIASSERDELLGVCERYEKESGKGRFKWGKAEHARRVDYVKRVFSNKLFSGKLRFSAYKEQVNYDMATVVCIAKAVHFKEPESYTTLIYVDGLTKTKRKKYGSELRKLGVMTRKVQGVNKDENNALTRLADAMAGFVRDVIEKKDQELQQLYTKAVKEEVVIEV